jgi:O-antigen ligase
VGQLAGITAGIAAVGLIATLIMTGNATTTLSRFMVIAEQAEGERGVEGASRWLFWPAAVRFWLQSPVVGNGFQSFSYMFHNGSERPGAYPHNVPLQIAAELGLVGLVLMGVFVWSGLRHAGLHRLRTDPLMVCGLAYFMTAIQSSLFGKELTAGRKLFFAVALFAVPAATAAVRSRLPSRAVAARGRPAS